MQNKIVYNIEQSLSDAEKKQARDNIGAVSAADVSAVMPRPVLCVASWNKTWKQGTHNMTTYLDSDWTSNFHNRADVYIAMNGDNRPVVGNSSGKKLHAKVTLQVFPQLTAPLGNVHISTLASGNAAPIAPAGGFTDVNIYENNNSSFNCCAQWLYLRDATTGSSYVPDRDITFKYVLTVEGYLEA